MNFHSGTVVYVVASAILIIVLHFLFTALFFKARPMNGCFVRCIQKQRSKELIGATIAAEIYYYLMNRGDSFDLGRYVAMLNDLPKLRIRIAEHDPSALTWISTQSTTS